jgi:hypothetical protein
MGWKKLTDLEWCAIDFGSLRYLENALIIASAPPNFLEKTMPEPKRNMRWRVVDRYGNSIYLTKERWFHITDKSNHPEMIDYEEYLKTTLRKGKRRQEPLNPRKYRYFHFFSELPHDVNTIVAIVLFGFHVNSKGEMAPNNFVATAFFKHIQPKG